MASEFDCGMNSVNPIQKIRDPQTIFKTQKAIINVAPKKTNVILKKGLTAGFIKKYILPIWHEQVGLRGPHGAPMATPLTCRKNLSQKIIIVLQNEI